MEGPIFLLERVICHRTFPGFPYSSQYANCMWPLSREPPRNLLGALNSMGDEDCLLLRGLGLGQVPAKAKSMLGAMEGLRVWRLRYASRLLGSGVNNAHCLVLFGTVCSFLAPKDFGACILGYPNAEG